MSSRNETRGSLIALCCLVPTLAWLGMSGIPSKCQAQSLRVPKLDPAFDGSRPGVGLSIRQPAPMPRAESWRFPVLRNPNEQKDVASIAIFHRNTPLAWIPDK